MRISDWSSDVCASDLWLRALGVLCRCDQLDAAIPTDQPAAVRHRQYRRQIMEVRIDRLRETEAIVAGNQQRAPGPDQHDIAAGVDLAPQPRPAGRPLAFLPALALISTTEHLPPPSPPEQ